MHAKTPMPPAYRYLKLANTMLMLSLVVSIAAFLVAYPYASRFGLPTQVTAHLAIPICAGFLKLGYVMRLASQEAIQRMGTAALPVHAIAQH
ncbi:hypothetical protein P3G55_24035 [Leptospira sp. 96542]|nr:hypothetical protein [Leptospira sp. 96542]